MYNKIKYWNDRKDPNSEQSKNTTNLQVEWTKKFIKKSDKVLEYGPGVLRLIGLYENLTNIYFYDISNQYKSVVEFKCNEKNLIIDKYIIDSSGTIKTPFNDHEFDVVICSEVFLHSPENEITDLINELSRIGKRVIVTTWFENGNNIHSNHCWTRDYKKIINDNNLNLIYWEEDLFDNKQLGFIYSK